VYNHVSPSSANAFGIARDFLKFVNTTFESEYFSVADSKIQVSQSYGDSALQENKVGQSYATMALLTDCSVKERTEIRVITNVPLAARACRPGGPLRTSLSHRDWHG
jgi:ABC-type sulfate transport system substrate-binding protein